MSFTNRMFKESLVVVVIFVLLTAVAALVAAPFTSNKYKGSGGTADMSVSYTTGSDKRVLLATIPQTNIRKKKIDDESFSLDPRDQTKETSNLGNVGYVWVETNSNKWDVVVSAKNGGRLVRPITTGETEDNQWGMSLPDSCPVAYRTPDTTWGFAGSFTLPGTWTCQAGRSIPRTNNPKAGGKYLNVNVGNATTPNIKPALLEFGIGTVAGGFTSANNATASLNTSAPTLLDSVDYAESFVKVTFDSVTTKVSLAEKFAAALEATPVSGRAGIQNLSALGIITADDPVNGSPVTWVGGLSGRNIANVGFPQIQTRGIAASTTVPANGTITNATLGSPAQAAVGALSVNSHNGIFSYAGTMLKDPLKTPVAVGDTLSGMVFYVNARLVEETVSSTGLAAAGISPYTGQSVALGTKSPLVEDLKDNGTTPYKETLTFTFWCQD